MFCPHSLLHGAELHSHDELCFGGHVLEHVCFESPEHVRSQHVVKLLDLVLLGDVGELLQETFKITAEWKKGLRSNPSTHEDNN